MLNRIFSVVEVVPSMLDEILDLITKALGCKSLCVFPAGGGVEQVFTLFKCADRLDDGLRCLALEEQAAGAVVIETA